MGNNKPLLAHLCLFGSGAFWGPDGTCRQGCHDTRHRGHRHGIIPRSGRSHPLRLTSLFTRREHIPTTDIIKLAGAGLFGLVFNQCC